MRPCQATLPGAGVRPGHPWPVVQPAALCHWHNGLASPKAFRGELTAEWREQYPDLISGENSDQALLESIKIEQVNLKPKKKVRKKSAA
ncbi:MAG: hypothetical protein ABW131_13470 [Candidatus Sedimenticola sp. 6PFRAG5]